MTRIKCSHTKLQTKRRKQQTAHLTLTRETLPSPPSSPPPLTTQPCSVVTEPAAAGSPGPAEGSSSAQTCTASPSSRTLAESSACPHVWRRSSSVPEALDTCTENLASEADRSVERVTHMCYAHSHIMQHTQAHKSIQTHAHHRHTFTSICRMVRSRKVWSLRTVIRLFGP